MASRKKSAGVILSSAYISAGMVSEFGLLPPAFLPLANKRLYRWQIEGLFLKTDKIVMSVPRDFALKRFDRDWLKERNVDLLPIDADMTLGIAVATCLDSLDKGIDDVRILFGNLFFDFRSLTIKAVDPRGKVCGAPCIYGDYRYDIAKLAHSIDGLYDYIVAGLCNASVDDDYNIRFVVCESNRIKSVRNIFGRMKICGIRPFIVPIDVAFACG